MLLNKAIKDTIGQGEKIEKVFSIGYRHIILRLIFSFLIWLFFFAIATALLIFGNNFFQTAEKSYSSILSFQAEIFGANWLSGYFLDAWFLLLAIFFLVIFILLFYNLFYLRVANVYIFTSERLIIKKGWLNTEIKSADYDRITDITVKQSFLHKIIYNSGTISVSTAGSDGYELVLTCIENPQATQKILSDLVGTHEKKYN